ncbi:MAG: glycoside hydrolase family 43 protein [Clostridia bacterium]|nr:glycoside hydrolase family 43 protein [Clostridia bacterium]
MKPEKNAAPGGYLFVHFTGEHPDGEQIYMALSRDGLCWADLSEKPVLRSSVGMKGVRDPFPVRDPKTGKCFILATDLRIAAGLGWGAAQYEGSRDIVVWESDDLVHWSRERAVTVGIPQAGCVWAPEAVYDPEKENFFVFFASMVSENGGEPKQRIYACRTADFKAFTEPFQWIERPGHVIDTTLFEHEGRYFRVSGDDFTHHLLFETADTLEGTWTKISSPTLDALSGIEGPECYPLPDGRTVCLIADFIWTGEGYLPMTTDAPGERDFTLLPREAFDMGVMKKRHGGVMPITEEEYARLTGHFGI